MVRKYFEAMCLLLVIFFVCACASQPLPPPEWRYEKEAIHIHLEADSQLNFSEGMPHTLLICVYQLRDPNVFNQLAGDNDGLYKLLECGLFDASVTSSKRLIINPGQDSNLVLDRSEGSKYLAVLAGYYLIQKERIIRLLDIPVIVEKKGWIKRTKISKPGPLNIELILGPQQIQKLEVK
jgi:type VI secretion system VasD/TssJ family lipoprotein